MQIFINKEEVEIRQGQSLGDVLAERGLDAPGTAVAVNNRVVPRADRAAYILEEGANIVVIKAVCGG